MDQNVQRYYELKQQQKEIEQELTALRSEILNHCTEQGASELELEHYKVKIVHQERKEFDDNKLYTAVVDPTVWRMLSKADPSKIASLLKLNFITEEKIKDTYSTKKISLLQVDKK
nr:hypothetical protein [Paenibacillus assamensis]